MAYSTQSSAAGRLQYLNQGKAPDSNMPNKRFRPQPKQKAPMYGKTGGTMAPYPTNFPKIEQ